MRPITTATLILATLSGLAGCAAYPATGDVTVARAAAAEARPIRVAGRLKPMAAPGFKLKNVSGFNPWSLADVARLVLTAEEDGSTVDTLERSGPFTGEEAFGFNNLKPGRVYKIALAAYDGLDELVSVPDASWVEVDTGASEGVYDDAIEVAYPLQFADRVFPGKLTAQVGFSGVASAIEVTLQRDDEGAWTDVQTTEIGAEASGYVRFANLRVGQTYRVRARAISGGSTVASDDSDAFVADPSTATADGDLPDVDLTLNAPA